MKTIFISTACPYVNAKPHIGHALEYLQADCYARFQRQVGNVVFFMTGTDENSLKNVQAAEKLNISTEELCKTNAQAFIDFKSLLNISYDAFLRTTEKKHFEVAQDIWRKCKKDIYRKSYRGLYCVGCEAFYTEDELVDGVCPEHKKKPEIVEEENYFFKLSKYEDRIRELIEKDKLKINPESRKNEVLGFIKKGLQDFSVSRSVKRAHGWGIPVPDDSTQIMYVWFDALIYYLTTVGYLGNPAHYEKFWIKADQRLHVIGKGILKFHAIYWIGMLMSAGVPLPTTELAHGYLTVDGEKISKSLGNTISPHDVVDKYGIDATRYYFLREIPPFSDGDFSYSRFNEIYNADLANNLGNLVSRLAKLSANINYIHSHDESGDKFYPEVENQVNQYRFDEALKCVFEEITKLNKFIDAHEPWKLEKKDLEKFLHEAVNQLAQIAWNLQPFLPDTSKTIESLFINTIKESVSPLFKRIS